jgi:hypothetical protein
MPRRLLVLSLFLALAACAPKAPEPVAVPASAPAAADHGGAASVSFGDPAGNVLVSRVWSGSEGSVSVDALGNGQATLHFSVAFKPSADAGAAGQGSFRLTGRVRCDHVSTN